MQTLRQAQGDKRTCDFNEVIRKSAGHAELVEASVNRLYNSHFLAV